MEIVRTVALCTDPPSKEECVCLCTDPPSTWQRVYTAPTLMTASYPDGLKRKGFAELKESAKLHREAAVSGKEKRQEIAKEIRKLGVKNNIDN